MNTKKIFDDVQTKIAQVMASSAAKDIEKNSRALLTKKFASVDLVKEEDFLIQKLLIEKMEQRIAQLEERLEQLERKVTPSAEDSQQSEAS